MNPKLPRSTCVNFSFAQAGWPLSELSVATHQLSQRHQIVSIEMSLTAAHDPCCASLLDCDFPLRQVCVHKIEARYFGIKSCPVGLDSVSHPVFQREYAQQKSVVVAILKPFCVLSRNLSCQVWAAGNIQSQNSSQVFDLLLPELTPHSQPPSCAPCDGTRAHHGMRIICK